MTDLVGFLLTRIEEEAERAQFMLNASDRWAWAWPPERVLAECEAKRRIIKLHPLQLKVWPYCECSVERGVSIDRMLEVYPDTDGRDWPCPTLRALAAPYAGHPDYREEWKP